VVKGKNHADGKEEVIRYRLGHKKRKRIAAARAGQKERAGRRQWSVFRSGKGKKRQGGGTYRSRCLRRGALTTNGRENREEGSTILPLRESLYLSLKKDKKGGGGKGRGGERQQGRGKNSCCFRREKEEET